MWRPGFSFVASRRAVAHRWERRFWQGSPDHRGVPEAPGRVVTLVPTETGSCIGVAFRVAAADTATVVEMLDHRERGGYRRVEVDVTIEDETPARAVAYVADPDNPHYLGTAAVEAIAAQIAACHGPSGANREYVLELAQALRDLGAHDDHVFELEAVLRAMTTAASCAGAQPADR
ncbi:MAG TPA: gamma-glutamylcyclotransferase [Candidatus Binatia bacterium]|nr:gamma-glutamylcyclotransferase [Candidatus Binatia bacterium]